MKGKVKEAVKKLLCGELKLNKRDLWFVGIICFLVGVIYGLKTAAMTHGISIGCNCGNNNGNGHGCDCNCGEDCDCDCENTCDCDTETCSCEETVE